MTEIWHSNSRISTLTRFQEWLGPSRFVPSYLRQAWLSTILGPIIPTGTSNSHHHAVRYQIVSRRNSIHIPNSSR